MKKLTITTRSRSDMIDISGEIGLAIRESGVKDGLCHVFVPHTTAAVTINENADPDVPRDILMELDKIIPESDHYSHLEGNSAAHIKASLMGSSETIFVEDGSLLLGRWQSVFFCEFDGPRTRRVVIRVEG